MTQATSAELRTQHKVLEQQVKDLAGEEPIRWDTKQVSDQAGEG